jgi:hypothetical protein
LTGQHVEVWGSRSNLAQKTPVSPANILYF